MDDLINQLSQFLSTEGGQSALKEISSLFDGSGSSASSEGADVMGSLMSMIGSSENSNEKKDNHSSFDSADLIKLLGMFSQMKENDDSRLLLSLKPYLKSERQEKVDQAVKILKLMEMLPILKESGILSSLL